MRLELLLLYRLSCGNVILDDGLENELILVLVITTS